MTDSKSKKVVITVTGKDTPGITSSLSKIVARDGIRLLDIEQSLTCGILSLSFVVEFSDASISDPILKDMLFKSKELGLSMDFKPLEIQTQAHLIKDQFVVTLISDELSAGHISAVSEVLARKKVNIDSIRKLSQDSLACVELITYTDSKIDLNALKEDLLITSAKFPGLDIAIQKENIYRRAKRLVVMDMDSTLIQCEVIDELAKIAGVGEKVSHITERAMNGEIDYDESLRERVALLKGLPESVLKDVAEKIPLTEGAEVLIHALQNLGYKIALISGGFSYFGKYLKAKLNLDYVFTDVLEIKDGKLTGLLGSQEIINAEKKGELLERIAAQEKIPLESVIAIGDGANDVVMLKKAGLGIAFNAKKKTQRAADASINRKLSSILYLLGITDKDIQTAIGK